MADNSVIATQLIDDDLGPTGVSKMPEAIHDWCVARVTVKLGEIENLVNGLVMSDVDSEAIRISQDPLSVVRKTLNRYKGIGAVG